MEGKSNVGYGGIGIGALVGVGGEAGVICIAFCIFV
jgi:hypothetical protein